MKIKDIQNEIERAIIAVATANNKGEPHNIAVMYVKVKDGKIIITDNYMKTTVENIKENGRVSLVLWTGKKGWRIDGEAEYVNSGKYMDFVRALSENKEEPCRGAIIVNPTEIKGIG